MISSSQGTSMSVWLTGAFDQRAKSNTSGPIWVSGEQQRQEQMPDVSDKEKNITASV